jgi:transposase InsO family protein
LDDAGMIQSMSRVSRCIDNGPIEAFWGMLKSEMYYLKKFNTYDELEAAITDYIDYYNNHRYHLQNHPDPADSGYPHSGSGFCL